MKRYLSLKDLSLSSSASSDSELSKDEEADLEEEAAWYERDRYDPDWSYKTNPLKKRGGGVGWQKSKIESADSSTL